MSNRGRWQKGQSGNPRGSAPRALATVLREVGEHDSFGDITNKKLLARMIWQALACGSISLVGGRTFDLTLKEWLDLAKWLHQHVDGSLSVGEFVDLKAEEEAEARERELFNRVWYEYNHLPDGQREELMASLDPAVVKGIEARVQERDAWRAKMGLTIEG